MTTHTEPELKEEIDHIMDSVHLQEWGGGTFTFQITPMKLHKLFIAVTVASLATMLVSVSAHASNLAFDAAGNLFRADGPSVFKYTPDGTKSTFATGLKEPLGLSFDSKGNLFVSDGAVTDAKSQLSILKFNADETKSTFVTGISSAGMAFDRSGNLYVSDGDSIFKFTPEGKKSTFVSGLGNPIDIAFDADGDLFVVDMAVTDARIGRSIVKFSPDGTKRTVETGLKDPSAIAADDAGNVFVTEPTASDGRSHAILKLSSGRMSSTFTSGVGTDRPLGMAVDRSGDVFVSNKHSILKFDSSGTPSTFASDWVSPDKHWEYRRVNGVSPEIVKAGTSQVVLDPSEDLNLSRPEEAEVVWAPDSKRFAFNYTATSAAHTSYKMIALYQLRGDKWVALRSLVDESSERVQLAQLFKKQLPKSAYLRSAEPIRDILKVRNWSDANTAIVYGYAAWTGGGPQDSKASFLFTLKFDAEGNWKIVKTHRMSKKEVEEQQ